MRSVNTQSLPSRPSDPVAQTYARLACAACVGRLAEAEFQLLPESDAEVVAEHLSSCPDCRLFKEQLDTTREILASMPAPDRPADLADILGDAQHELADGQIEHSLQGLYRIASALDLDNADDLVQQTLLDAIGMGAPLSSAELADALIRAANGTLREPTESLDEASDPGSSGDPASSAYDSDSDAAELFYPEFYVEGPDVGRFIDSPNAWGHALPRAPEDELATSELFEVAGRAINALPEREMQLITLVDLESIAFEDAAAALRLPERRAARALNDARIHVRGAVDNYLTANRT